MRYWVRTVSDSIIRSFGVSFITDVSKSRTMRSTVQTLMKIFSSLLFYVGMVWHFKRQIWKTDKESWDLCVKGVELKLVGAFEGLCINLHMKLFLYFCSSQS